MMASGHLGAALAGHEVLVVLHSLSFRCGHAAG
jgi:hypothetical protein